MSLKVRKMHVYATNYTHSRYRGYYSFAFLAQNNLLPTGQITPNLFICHKWDPVQILPLNQNPLEVEVYSEGNLCYSTFHYTQNVPVVELNDAERGKENITFY